MHKFSKLIFTLALFAALAIGSYYWQSQFFASISTYRSPLADNMPPPGAPLPAQTSQVVLVIIGGLGFEITDLLDLPTIERLRESGVDAISESEPPTFPLPTWTTLLSGAGPSINNSAPLFPLAGEVRPITVPSLLDAAQEQDLRIGVLGHRRWVSTLSGHDLSYTFSPTSEGASGDRAIIDDLNHIIEDEAIDLLLIYLDQVEYAGHNFGGTEDSAYHQAAQQVDLLLAELLAMLDLDRSTLIITADYGHIEQGGHGGKDLAVTQQPFIMFGRGIIPSNYSPIKQTDIAPTIAALLGLRLPAANQGQPRLEMIQTSDEDQATILAALASQRVALAQSFLQVLDIPFSEQNNIEADIDRTQEFLVKKNFSGAAQLSRLVIDETDIIIENALAQRQAAEARPRLLILLGLVITAIFFILWQRTELWGQAFLGGMVIVGAYHGLYRLQDLPYSISAMTSVEQIWIEAAQRMSLALLAGLLFFWVLLVLKQYDQASTVFLSGFEMIFFAILGFSVPALLGFRGYGLSVTWYLPDISTLYLHYTALVQTFQATVLGIFVPIILVLSNNLVQKWINHYQIKQIQKIQTRSASHQQEVSSANSNHRR